MKTIEKSPSPVEAPREFRGSPRSRPTFKTPVRRRRAGRSSAQGLVAEAQTGFVLQRYWDDHAVKTGMALFWGWFLVVNGKGLMQVSGELAKNLMGY